MRAIGWLMVCNATIAGADDAPVGESAGITLRTERGIEPGPPLLHLDIDLGVATENVGAEADRHATVLELGRRARMVAEGEWWKSSLTPKVFGPDIEDVSHGWRAGSELSYDVGLFRVGASVAYGHVDSRFQRGTYRVVGLSVSRTFRLSRWRLAWISLGIGEQKWLDIKPPPGEANQTTRMLSIGTTFR